MDEIWDTLKKKVKVSRDHGKVQIVLSGTRFVVEVFKVGIKFEKHDASDSPEEALRIAKAQNNPEELLCALINIGNFCAAAGKNKEAIRHYQEALTISQELQSVSIETTCALLNELGFQYSVTEELEFAIQFYRNALKIAQNHQVKEQELHALMNIGCCLHESQNYKEAIEYNFEAIGLTKQLQDRVNEGIVYFNLRRSYTSLCEYQTAIEYLKKALMISKERGDDDQELELSKMIGETFAEDGQLKEAIPYYESALKLSKETAHKVEETSLHNSIGFIYYELEEYEKAILCCKESLKLAQQFGGKDQEYLALQFIGNSLRAIDRSDEAIENFKEALDIVQDQPDKGQETMEMYVNLGISYTNLDQPERALEHQRVALKIAQELKDEEQELEILGKIAWSKEMIGQYDEEAIGYYSRMLELHQQQEGVDNKTLLSLYNGLGLCYENTKQYTEAIAFFEKVFKIAMTLGDRDQARLALDRMAFSREELGQSDDAIACYLEQLEIVQAQNDPAAKISVNRNLARHYSKTKEYVLSLKCHENALEVAQQQDDEEEQLGILTDIRVLMETVGQHDEKAVEFYQKPDEMTLCNYIGRCYMTMKQYEEALSHFEKALEFAKELKNKSEEGTICHRIAICKGFQDHVENAIQYDMQALDIAQEQEDKAKEALLYRILGVRFRNVGQYDLAVQFSQRAQNLAQELGDLDTELEAKRDL